MVKDMHDANREYTSFGSWKIQPLGSTMHPNHCDLEHTDCFKAIIEKRSFNNELVLLPVASSEADLGMNMVSNLQHAGIQHYIIITTSVEACRVYRENNISGCVVTSYLHEKKAHGAQQAELESEILSAAKLRYLLACIRAPLNCLALETHVLLARTPYAFLKASPLASYSLLFPTNHGSCRAGVLYVQKANPGGKVETMLKAAMSAAETSIGTNHSMPP
eukprot:gene22796-27541_t